MPQQEENPIRVYEGIVRRARHAITAVKADQMKKPTPCTDWDVATLLEHIATAQEYQAKALSGSAVPPAATVVARIDAASAAIIKAMQAPGAMEKKVQGRQGEVPAAQMFGSATMDLAIHTWDLARAVGGDTKMDPRTVDFLFPVAERIAQRGPSKAFAPPVDVPTSASKQDRLLALTGRKP